MQGGALTSYSYAFVEEKKRQRVESLRVEKGRKVILKGTLYE